MKSIKNMDVAELAAFVCSHLYKNGIKCVLTGGACISIYSDNKYESYDLDFIDNAFTPHKILTKVMSEIGFSVKGRYFINTDSSYLIEFPTGPLSIGSQQVNEITELTYKTGKLLILSPTDSVKDRLAAFYHWDDKQALEQAKLVIGSQKVKLKDVEIWSEKEGFKDKFSSIKKYLKVK
jgi:hypothetical protein